MDINKAMYMAEIDREYREFLIKKAEEGTLDKKLTSRLKRRYGLGQSKLEYLGIISGGMITNKLIEQEVM
jgi:hypothetical protein